MKEKWNGAAQKQTRLAMAVKRENDEEAAAKYKGWTPARMMWRGMRWRVG